MALAPMNRVIWKPSIVLVAFAFLAAPSLWAVLPQDPGGADGVLAGPLGVPSDARGDRAVEPPAASMSQAPAAQTAFTRNDGQVADSSIRYYTHAGGVLVGLGDGFARYVVGDQDASAARVGAVVTVWFEGARPIAPTALEATPGTRNFLLGPDESLWKRAVPSFETLVYREVWPGIDLTYRATESGAKYEVIAQPGADLSVVGFRYDGAASLYLTADGAVVAETAAGPVTDSAPTATSAGEAVACSFALRSAATVGFSCPRWDGTDTLVVDPLVTSTFIGGSSTDQGRSVHVAPDGTIFVGGYSTSNNFPTTAGSFDPTWNSGYDFTISKFDSTGAILLWSTYIGGTSTDFGNDMFVDPQGNVYMTGQSLSSNFPTTPGAHANTSRGGYDAVALKLDPTGTTLLFSTYLGGGSTDNGYGIAVGANNTVYVTGLTQSVNFSTTPGAYDNTSNGGADQFVAQLNQTGALLASTYIGGSSTDQAYHLRTDSNGRPVTVGTTLSTNWPTTSNGFQKTNLGNYDATITVFSDDLSTLQYSSYFGGSSTDTAYQLAVTAAGVAFVTGATASTNFPTAGSTFSSSLQGSYDVFLSKFDLGTGGLTYSSYFGGSSTDMGYGVAVNSLGEAIVTGYTQSTNFPTSSYRDQQNFGGGVDMFILRVTSTGNALVYGSFLGGSTSDYGYSVALDANGTAHVTGYTASSNFPITPNAFDNSISGTDSFLMKVELRKPRLTLLSNPPGLAVFNANDNETTPFTSECTTLRRVNVPSPQYDGNTRYVFDHWSNAGPQLQTVDCSLGDLTLTAFFRTEFLANLSTAPADLPLTIDGVERPTPLAVWWANGSFHRIDAIPVYTSAGVRYGFSSWSLGGTGQYNYTATAPLELVGLYNISQYLFEAETDTPGTYLILDTNRWDGPISLWLDAGTHHDLAAPNVVTQGSDVRHVFANWSDDGPMARSFNANSTMDLIARFHTEYWTTLNTDPAGISLDLDGVDTTTPYGAWWREGESHRIKGPFNEVELGDTRYRLTGWVDSYASERTVYADAPAAYTALFTPSAFRTTVDTLPAGLQVVLDRETFTAPVELWWVQGTDHVIQAVSPQLGAGARYVFNGWSDHLQVTHVVTATAPATLIARYNTEYEVVVDTEPTGLTIQVDGAGATAPQTVWWREGQSHDIATSATQSVGENQRWDFDAWSDDGDRIHSVAVTGPTTFVATFAPTFRLTIQSAHAPPPCDVPDCWYRGGTTATFTVDSPQLASNGVRFVFSGWSGDYASPNASAAVLMDAPKTVVASWTLQYELRVESSRANVTGAGWYDEGTAVTVTVEPTQVTEGTAKYEFVGWSGASSSASPQASITMDGPKTVTATWRVVGAAGPEQPGGGEEQAGISSGLLIGIAVAGGGAAVAIILLSRRRRTETHDGLEGPAAGAAPPSDVHAQLQAPQAQSQAQWVAPAAQVPQAPKAAARPVRRQASPAAPAAARPAPVAQALKCPTCGMAVEASWAVCPYCEGLLSH